MGCAVVLLVLNFMCVCLALGANLAALTGYSWWKYPGYEVGLWRVCGIWTKYGLFTCQIREHIFSKDGSWLDRAVVLILLIISCGFLFISLISTLTMFCCQGSKACWCCGAVTVATFLHLGAGTGIAAMVYGEVTLPEPGLKHFTRGWSNILGWVGVAIAVIATVLSSAMCCVHPKQYRGGNVNVVVNPPYAPPQVVVGKDYPMVNRGYQHGY